MESMKKLVDRKIQALFKANRPKDRKFFFQLLVEAGKRDVIEAEEFMIDLFGERLECKEPGCGSFDFKGFICWNCEKRIE